MQPPNRFRPQPATRLPGTIERQAWSAWQQLEQSQWMDRDSLESLQFQKLHQLLKHCAEHVPYYRELFGGVGKERLEIRNMQEFRQLPTVDRRNYSEDSGRMVSETLPDGISRYGQLSTSGTTGIPITVQTTNDVQAQWLAFTLRDLDWCGIDPRGKFAAIRCSGASGALLEKLRRGLTLPHWGKTIAELVETGSGSFMDVSADPIEQMAWLRTVDPEYLLSYPSNLEILASLVSNSGGSLLRLKKIQTVAEVLEPSARQRIEAAFGVPVCDTYSCCEAGYLASPCPSGYGFHIHSENVILEVLDDQDLPCQPGETGRVVVTTLNNFATAFIRYDIHDEAECGPNDCPCGRRLPTLTRIHGKRRPMLRLPGGRLKSSTGIAIAIRSLESVLQYQVIQGSDDQIHLKIIPKILWKNEDSQRVSELLFEFFEARIPLTLELVSRIEPTAGGKVVDVVVEAPVRSG